MTIEQEVKKYLFENGLWADECDQIFEVIKKDTANTNIRWSDSLEGYPAQFKTALIYAVKQHAITWLRANKPQHFALMMLEGV